MNLEKTSLIRRENACSAEGDKQFFDRIELDDAIRKARNCLHKLVVWMRRIEMPRCRAVD